MSDRPDPRFMAPDGKTVWWCVGAKCRSCGFPIFASAFVAPQARNRAITNGNCFWCTNQACANHLGERAPENDIPPWLISETSSAIGA